MSKLIGAVSLAIAIAIAAAASASEEEHAPVARGTRGLLAVPFRADNLGPGDMECKAALAHWYSVDLGRAAAGGRLSTTLWYDPADGNVFLLNATEDHMPVQMLWCGPEPEAWANRATIRLERKKGATPPPIHVSCRLEGDELACR